MVGTSSVRNGQAAMRTFTFSDEVLAEIRHDRYHHPHPRVQRKMEVLWLKSQGLTHAEIARLADVAPRSVQRYLDDFHAGQVGWEVARVKVTDPGCPCDCHAAWRMVHGVTSGVVALCH